MHLTINSWSIKSILAHKTPTAHIFPKPILPPYPSPSPHISLIPLPPHRGGQTLCLRPHAWPAAPSRLAPLHASGRHPPHSASSRCTPPYASVARLARHPSLAQRIVVSSSPRLGRAPGPPPSPARPLTAPSAAARPTCAFVAVVRSELDRTPPCAAAAMDGRRTAAHLSTIDEAIAGVYPWIPVGHGHGFLPTGTLADGHRLGRRYASGRVNLVPAHTRPAAIPCHFIAARGKGNADY
jgi:hypothetical protein